MSAIGIHSPVRSREGPAAPSTASAAAGRSAPAGGFVRKAVDGVGRPFRGPMETTGLTAQQQIDPAALALVNSNLHNYFQMLMPDFDARQTQVTLTLPNGDTATITGDAKNQNVRIQTQRGLVQEASIGVNGAQAVRGFQSPRELHDQLALLQNARGWEDIRTLPDR